MTQIIQAKDTNLRYLIDNFGIQLVLDDSFFHEVKVNLPRYALSKGFLMRNPGNELYDVLRILKRLTLLVSA
ncbi:hypothetical protein LC613_03980 [Nostoc sphaeroides CHAB 2801]|uniref:Uncharacterized protein n=1 Tax=Nostoc sphaeroides CCNUC1 TaxID=2653204 RepID=A0A5P8W8Y2_9NOSO|nr:hypothetical protein [Nostoc sphaeroides]MCC5627366.1 hypothetical protein [Nostoc sphaeroides CHAB 2801]QFS49215.1 hypothetical protein GXM_06709 [Nostoc sphaeroides CCNUC1]